MASADKHSKVHRKSTKDKKEKLDVKVLVKTYKVFGTHYKKYVSVLICAYVSLFAAVTVAALEPWPLKLILDHLILGEALPETIAFLHPMMTTSPRWLLLILAVSILGLAIITAVLSYVNKFWVASTGARIVADIRAQMFTHLQRLSLSFHNSARSGDLVYLLTSDVAQMKHILIDVPQEVLHRLFTFSIYTVLMLALDWRLSLVAFCSLPLFVLTTRYFGSGMKTAMKKSRQQEGEIASIIVDNVTAMPLVQAYGREESERNRFQVESTAGLRARLQALRLLKTHNRLSDFIVTMTTAGVLYLGGRYALGGDILPGTLVVFVAYLGDIYGAVEKFNGLLINLASSQVAAERLLDVIENDTAVQDAPDAMPAPSFAGRVEFKDVGFAYRKDKPVLQHLNFVIEPGTTVALVGHSGAGKSTLISLLLRFYGPQQGQILIDGSDFRRFTLKSLRERITIVLQDAKLFHQTVRENISFGKQDATDEEIVTAAQLAQAHDFIVAMPQGYDTMMAERGDNLSGGQKQRLNIARAIIRDTPIVILDEPVTGLDARAEAKVHAAIQQLTKGKTTFLIAHKLATVVKADTILLLEEGQLVHQGTHEQLLRESEHYRQLWALQGGTHSELIAAETSGGTTNGAHRQPMSVTSDERG